MHQQGHRFTDIERLRAVERMERLEVDRVIKLALEIHPLQSVIDIGTGSGIFAEAFAAHGLRVSGIDANPEMLVAARQYVPAAEFREAAAERIPFPDNSFDLALMGLVLHETDDPKQALREARRVSRYAVVVLEWPYAEQPFGPGLDERFRQEEIAGLAQQAGFSRIETIPLKSLVVYRLVNEVNRSNTPVGG